MARFKRTPERSRALRNARERIRRFESKFGYQVDVDLTRLNIPQLNRLRGSTLQNRARVVINPSQFENPSFTVTQKLYKQLTSALSNYNTLLEKYQQPTVDISDIYAKSPAGIRSYIRLIRSRTSERWFSDKQARALDNFIGTLWLAQDEVETAIRDKISEMGRDWAVARILEANEGHLGNLIPGTIYDSVQGVQYDSPRRILEVFEIPYEQVYPNGRAEEV